MLFCYFLELNFNIPAGGKEEPPLGWGKQPIKAGVTPSLALHSLKAESSLISTIECIYLTITFDNRKKIPCYAFLTLYTTFTFNGKY